MAERFQSKQQTSQSRIPPLGMMNEQDAIKKVNPATKNSLLNITKKNKKQYVLQLNVMQVMNISYYGMAQLSPDRAGSKVKMQFKQGKQVCISMF